MVLHCAILLIIYSFYNIKFYSGQKTSMQWFVGADPVNAKRWEFFLTQFSIWGGGGIGDQKWHKQSICAQYVQMRLYLHPLNIRHW